MRIYIQTQFFIRILIELKYSPRNKSNTLGVFFINFLYNEQRLFPQNKRMADEVVKLLVLSYGIVSYFA